MNLEYKLNSNESERYKRQLLLETDYGFSQKKLKQATVFIAGAGGLGSSASIYLAAAGVGRLIIADYDLIDMSNLNRQILYSTAAIGELKAESARRRLTELNPEIAVEIRTVKLEGDISKLIDGADLIIDCLDNIETRYVLNDFSLKTRIPIVHGGINGYAGQISFIAPPETACLRCIFPDAYKADGPIPVIGATAGIIGSMQAMEAVKYLTESGELLKNKLLIIDGFTWEIANLNLERNPSCRACGASSA
ncbi:MAG: HesA/MoeB/ThiF family protein [Spirochaetales bacterium]|nr:HesA/MoeB/ThiF family protein [Spirochaetales bacterium]